MSNLTNCSMARRFELTDREWDLVKDYLPKGNSNTKKDGRPRADDRKLLNGMIWLLRTGAPWEDLPDRYGSKSTAHRRFSEWVRTGVFEQISLALDEEFDFEELREESSWQIDSTVVPAHRCASGAPKKSGDETN